MKKFVFSVLMLLSLAVNKGLNSQCPAPMAPMTVEEAPVMETTSEETEEVETAPDEEGEDLGLEEEAEEEIEK